MDGKYRIFREMDIEYINFLLDKADLTSDEYWVLKYSIGNDTNRNKLCRLDICDRLGFSFATLFPVATIVFYYWLVSRGAIPSWHTATYWPHAYQNCLDSVCSLRYLECNPQLILPKYILLFCCQNFLSLIYYIYNTITLLVCQSTFFINRIYILPFVSIFPCWAGPKRFERLLLVLETSVLPLTLRAY